MFGFDLQTSFPSAFLVILIIGVAVMLALVAWVNRDSSPMVEEEDDPDYHTLRSDYQSGMGGGSMRTWKVPKDPDEYARYFVPHGKTGKKSKN